MRPNGGQIVIKEFHLPFGDAFDSDRRWAWLEELTTWGQVEEVCESQFNATLLLFVISTQGALVL